MEECPNGSICQPILGVKSKVSLRNLHSAASLRHVPRAIFQLRILKVASSNSAETFQHAQGQDVLTHALDMKSFGFRQAHQTGNQKEQHTVRLASQNAAWVVHPALVATPALPGLRIVLQMCSIFGSQTLKNHCGRGQGHARVAVIHPACDLLQFAGSLPILFGWTPSTNTFSMHQGHSAKCICSCFNTCDILCMT